VVISNSTGSSVVWFVVSRVLLLVRVFLSPESVVVVVGLCSGSTIVVLTLRENVV